MKKSDYKDIEEILSNKAARLEKRVGYSGAVRSADLDGAVNEDRHVRPHSPALQIAGAFLAAVIVGGGTFGALKYMEYKGALRRIEVFGGINAINTAIGNMLQSMTQSITGAINSEATRMGAEQQKEQEQLDPTKDLFSQAQNVVDAAIKLMQAVLQAETQSMRDAIQA